MRRCPLEESWLKKINNHNFHFNSFLFKVHPHCVKDLAVVISAQQVFWVLQPCALGSEHLNPCGSKTQDGYRPHFTDGENEVQGGYMSVQGLLGTHCESQPWKPDLLPFPEAAHSRQSSRYGAPYARARFTGMQLTQSQSPCLEGPTLRRSRAWLNALQSYLEICILFEQGLHLFILLGAPTHGASPALGPDPYEDCLLQAQHLRLLWARPKRGRETTPSFLVLNITLSKAVLINGC